MSRGCLSRVHSTLRFYFQRRRTKELNHIAWGFSMRDIWYFIALVVLLSIAVFIIMAMG